MTRISEVRSAIIRHLLAEPILYGNWIMRHREFILVRVDLDDGPSGFAYGLTRDGPVAEIIERSVRPSYVGQDVSDPADLFYSCLWTNHAVHAAGIGMRALSLVDLAAWDAHARAAGTSVTRLLGGSPSPLPATAICAYPPTMSPAATATQISALLACGWTRFKLPIAPDLDLSVARLAAAREAAPDAWIGFDINMVLRSSSQVLELEARLRDLKLGWIEDVVPPGDARAVAEVRLGSTTPVAMGDEQGGSYHPEALLAAGAIDVLRVDATTNGGLTRLPRIVELALASHVAVAPHMFPHIHSRIMAGLGQTTAPIEWGVPGTGIHPMDDSLEQPVIVNGLMQPLADEPGFGRLVDLEWIDSQEVQDPRGVLRDVPSSVMALHT